MILIQQKNTIEQTILNSTACITHFDSSLKNRIFVAFKI